MQNTALPYRRMPKIASPCRRMVVVLALTTLGLASAEAQGELPEFDQGRRIRLVPLPAGGPTVTGNVFRSTADSIVIVDPESSYVHRSRYDLRRIDHSAGRSRADGAVRGMQFGLVAAGVMGVIGAVPQRRPDQSSRADAAFESLIGTLLFSVPIGALTGAIIGRERWETWWVSAPDRNRR